MIIGDINYLLRVKGFSHGASGDGLEKFYSEEFPGTEHYNRGYAEGIKAREDYIKKLNDEILGCSVKNKSDDLVNQVKHLHSAIADFRQFMWEFSQRESCLGKEICDALEEALKDSE